MDTVLAVAKLSSVPSRVSARSMTLELEPCCNLCKTPRHSSDSFRVLEFILLAATVKEVMMLSLSEEFGGGN